MSETAVCDNMLVGYARVSKTDGYESLDPQRDALGARPASTPSTSITTAVPRTTVGES